jgi:hypothetical protein
MPRPANQRAAGNERYNERRLAAGLVKHAVIVPMVRIPELDSLLVAWRREAKTMLESDQPSADQILMIHGICRTLRIKLPVGAFATRLTADAWIREKHELLGQRRAQVPRRRPMT